MIALLGGSSAFTPSLASALADRAAALPALEVRLWGRSSPHLAAVERFCNLHVGARGIGHDYLATTDLDLALRGSDLVVCQVRIGGFDGRSYDETFPHAHGLPGDETIGPGGLASALRSVPAILALGRRVRELAPGVPLVVTSNPLGILLRALATIEGLSAFGLCELPEHTLQRAAAAADLDARTLTADYVGMNHQGAFVAVRTEAGDDVLPHILDRLAAHDEAGAFGVDADVMRAHGLLWLSYAKLFLHRDRTLRSQRQRVRDRGRELADLARQLLDHYATTASPALPAASGRRQTPWHAMALVPAIESLCHGRPNRLAVSQPNRGHLPWLPEDAIVEQFGPQVPLATPPPSPTVADPASPRLAPLVDLTRRIDAYERRAAKAGDLAGQAGELAGRAGLLATRAEVAACLGLDPLTATVATDFDALIDDILRAAPVPTHQEVRR
ncbi:MAG: hypothetical protein KDC98_24830 [Planctomycetes bacterium]|nr:hypothetical protein [Planctomycetota bacterium]